VLDAFVANGIALDEVVIYDRQWFDDPEIHSAVSYAHQVKQQHMPKLVVNHVPVNHWHFASVYCDLGEDWIFSPGCSIMYPKMHRYFLQNHISSTARIIDQHSRRADIWAHDKPRVLLADGTWYNFGVDAGMYQYMNTDCEFFYMTNDLTDLHVAQCHMAIDHFENMIMVMGPDGFDHFHKVQGNQCLDWQYEVWNRAMGRTCVDNSSARQGWLKSRVAQNPNSPESMSAKNLIHDKNSSELGVWQQGLRDIETITKIAVPHQRDSDWLPVILSDWYPVRPLASNLRHLSHAK
jgi:hypothetical protein